MIVWGVLVWLAGTLFVALVGVAYYVREWRRDRATAARIRETRPTGQVKLP